MAIPFINVGGKITAALVNMLISGVNGVSVSGVVPTGIAGSGATLSPGGKITLNNCAAVTVSGVFTGSYDNYRVTWDIPQQTQNADLAMRLAAAGLNDTSGNYNYLRQFARGSDNTVNAQFTTAASQWLLTTGANAAQTNDGFMDIYGPALSQYTAGRGMADVYYPAVPQMYQTTTSIRHNVAQAFDGFTIFPISGVITGTVRVYGYNNLN